MAQTVASLGMGEVGPALALRHENGANRAAVAVVEAGAVLLLFHQNGKDIWSAHDSAACLRATHRQPRDCSDICAWI